VGAHELDPWTRDILWQVCHGGPYSSSVVLAIDLSDLGKLVDSLNAVPLLEMALQELNEAGLVVYSESPHHDHGQMPITRIRATADAFSMLGFMPPVKIVGAKYSRGSHASDHPGDGTDWRNQPPTTTGGEIERLPLREHMERYWEHSHVHFAALREIESRDDR
jgi:hypothetical protein